MAFSSIPFLLFFLPCFFLLYYALPFRNTVVLLGSLLFYAWGDPGALPLLLLFIAANWAFGLAARRRWALALGVATDLGLLLWFKYADFLVRQLDAAIPPLRLAPPLPPAAALPLGISFFAFQGISYLVDIHRGVVEPQRSLLRYATYKAMFPPLIAGPIVRYRFIAPSLGRRRVDPAEIRDGIVLLSIGLAQKVLLANTVGGAADRLFDLPPEQLSAGAAWLGAFAYALQIYFDFNGYTNMALGLGRMMGFRLPPNFDLPYASRSLTEFWRRWHISLSSWFRDYLYIPLGGNRRGRVRTGLNLLCVFVLCGFWHGAAWTFAVWGLWHGAFLALERTGFGRLVAALPRPARHAYLLCVVVVGWVPFRAADLPRAGRYLAAMAGRGGAIGAGPELSASVATALAAGAVLSVWRADPALLRLAPVARLRDAGCLALVVLCAARLAAGTYNPFIYFRF